MYCLTFHYILHYRPKLISSTNPFVVNESPLLASHHRFIFIYTLINPFLAKVIIESKTTPQTPTEAFIQRHNRRNPWLSFLNIIYKWILWGYLHSLLVAVQDKSSIRSLTFHWVCHLRLSYCGWSVSFSSYYIIVRIHSFSNSFIST